MIGPENDEIDREARSAISRITHTILSFALVGGLFSLGILMTRFLWMLTSCQSASSFAETFAKTFCGFISLLSALICFLTAIHSRDVRFNALAVGVFLVILGTWLVYHAAQYA